MFATLQVSVVKQQAFGFPYIFHTGQGWGLTMSVSSRPREYAQGLTYKATSRVGHVAGARGTNALM